MNIREQIKAAIIKAMKGMEGQEDLESLVQVTRTADPQFGDYSTNAAMKMARHSGDDPPIGGEDSRITNGADSGQARMTSKANHSPLDIAKKLSDSLQKQGYIEKVEVAGPGFVNIFVKPAFWQDEVVNVLKRGKEYGGGEAGKGKRARVEFVSANPTGPLHFGNARGGPIGDTLARVLEASGYEVLREYLHNDVGEQVRKLGESIINVANGAKLEDQEYKGEYIRELASVILGTSEARTPESKASHPEPDEVEARSLQERLVSGSTLSSPRHACRQAGKRGSRTQPITGFPIESGMTGKTATEVGKWATDLMLDETLADCEAMGIKFDKVFPESGFVQSGDTERAIAELDKKGIIRDKEGAKWFAPNDEFLKDRETVVVKSDGSYTYFSNDIAYHKIKFSEGYDLVVDVFGANHHGHVPRLQAVIKALGGDVSRFHVILYQWVRFKKGGEVLAMSKRSGNFITAKEILEMVGPDAVRFFVLMHDPNSHIDFDLDLAKEKSSKNPVFYVQYAHARICSILAKAPQYSSSDPASFVIPDPLRRSDSEASLIGDPENGSGLDSRFPACRQAWRGNDSRGRGNDSDGSSSNLSLLSTPYELELIKKIAKLPELVEDISTSFAVNALTTYATELADTFHKFYENCRVLPSEDEGAEKVTEELTRARLALVDATRITLANTLGLLGISAPEKM